MDSREWIHENLQNYAKSSKGLDADWPIYREGKQQRNRYLKKLEKRFQWLAENSSFGRHRSDICDGYYSFPHEHHVVFYLKSDIGIDIIGVPHQDMDVLNYFIET